MDSNARLVTKKMGNSSKPAMRKVLIAGRFLKDLMIRKY